MQVSLLVLALLPLVSAQFGFFDQIFQGHPAHQQQQQRPGGNRWAAQSEAGESAHLVATSGNSEFIA